MLAITGNPTAFNNEKKTFRIVDYKRPSQNKFKNPQKNHFKQFRKQRPNF